MACQRARLCRASASASCRSVPPGGSSGRPASSQRCASSWVNRGISRGSAGIAPHSCASATWSYAAYQAQSSIGSPGSVRNACRSARIRARVRQAGSPGEGSLSSTLRRTHGIARAGSNSVDTA